jgi:hypothetical protein
MYKIRSPDGQYLKKCGDRKLAWVAEKDATFFRKWTHVRRCLRVGTLAKNLDDADTFEGLPLSALRVLEYRVSILKTRRWSRLNEINKLKGSENELDVQGVADGVEQHSE